MIKRSSTSGMTNRASASHSSTNHHLNTNNNKKKHGRTVSSSLVGSFNKQSLQLSLPQRHHRHHSSLAALTPTTLSARNSLIALKTKAIATAAIKRGSLNFVLTNKVSPPPAVVDEPLVIKVNGQVVSANELAVAAAAAPAPPPRRPTQPSPPPHLLLTPRPRRVSQKILQKQQQQQQQQQYQQEEQPHSHYIYVTSPENQQKPLPSSAAASEAVAAGSPTTIAPSARHSDPNKNYFTWAEIQQHNTRDDCWVVVHKRVYDVTKFLPMHPGGPNKIITRCAGGDATKEWQHHSKTAKGMFRKYQIGKLRDDKNCSIQ